MIVTEKEAKEKFCPHMRKARMSDGEIYTPAINSLQTKRAETFENCIASECMQWTKQTITAKHIDKYGTTTETQEKTGKGFCGLAYK